MCILKSLTDQELISSYLGGSAKSIEVLIKRHRHRVFGYIYLIVKNRELAEDIFQDTFVKIINTLRSGSYKEEGKFLPWVVRIAHNLAIDHFRKENRMPKLRETEEFSIFDIIPDKQENAEEKTITRQIHQQVRSLIELLPREQREVLVMRHYGEMDFKEIASVTNVSINTALGRMRYALINLRKLIERRHMVVQ